MYYDGIDSVGRPVVVVNARADAMLQPKLRNRAMEYMKRRLEPIVYQVSRIELGIAVITVWKVHS